MTAPARYRIKVSTLTICRESTIPFGDRTTINDPAAAAALVREFLAVSGGDDDRERFVMASLDAQNRVLSMHLVSVGTQSASLVSTAQLLRVALLSGASAIIVGHNHPSGDPSPSREDLALTRKIKDACALLDIRLHDHLIVGDGTTAFVSLAQRGAI
jgi:DNA repair protein RadC